MIYMKRKVNILGDDPMINESINSQLSLCVPKVTVFSAAAAKKVVLELELVLTEKINWKKKTQSDQLFYIRLESICS